MEETRVEPFTYSVGVIRESPSGVSDRTSLKTILISTFEREKVSVKTPNFSERRAKGELFNNPYKTSVTERTPPSLVKLVATGTDNKGNWLGTDTYFGTLSDLSRMFPGKLRTIQVNPDNSGYIDEDSNHLEALKRANRADWDVGVMLAESGESLALIAQLLRAAGSPIRTLTNLVAKVGSKGQSPLGSLFKLGSEAWLTYRYGLMPILYDIEDAIRVARKRHKLDYRYSVRPTQTRMFTDEYQTEWLSARPSGSVWVPLFSTYDRRNDRLRTVCTTDFHYETWSSYYMDVLGLSFRHAPMILWEKLPFSFVIDWAIKVGDWLTAMSEPKGMTKRIANDGLKIGLDRLCPQATSQFVDQYVGFQWSIKVSVTRSQEITSSYSRQPITLEPPSLPPLKVNMTWKRWVDAAALVFLGCKRSLALGTKL